ncbi:MULTISPECIES: hypothetical protein [Cytobacillus]|uniref:hypothetical protein n=1 Tax=Cytobacillus TaxID=2675230 RepID=UPI00135A631E|nr:hypothetical protein [Cytobacillus sp. AMY 15.2]MCM3093702.1 hypothetical protein [Cytobacillus sp. AMY 15.2]
MKIGIVAFIIPFVFVYGPAILLQGTPTQIIVSTLTALIGAFVLASGVEGWFIGKKANVLVRILLIAASLTLIVPGLITDTIGLGLILASIMVQLYFSSKKVDQNVTKKINEIEG